MTRIVKIYARNISDFAFDGFHHIREVYIPSYIERIGDGAFRDCHEIRYVHFGGSSAQWHNIDIREGNEYLINAHIYYNDFPDESQPEIEISDISIEDFKYEYEYGEEFYAKLLVRYTDATEEIVEINEAEGFDSTKPGM